MRIFGVYLNKNRIIILSVLIVALVSYIFYIIIKYPEQVKLFFIVVIALILGVMLIYVMEQQNKKRFSSPEEESAYKRRMAELQAEQDHKESRKPRPKPLSLADMWSDSPKKKF